MVLNNGAIRYADLEDYTDILRACAKAKYVKSKCTQHTINYTKQVYVRN